MKHKLNPLFIYYPWQDTDKVRHKLCRKKRGIHDFFRRIKEPVRARLAELLPHEKCPIVFLFGSPHIDNYCRTPTGYGLIDFDRALYGPYWSDLCYFLLSLHFKAKKRVDLDIQTDVYRTFFEAYQQGIVHFDKAYPQFQPLMEENPVQKRSNWEDRARLAPIPSKDPFIQELLAEYLKNRSSELPHWELEIMSAGFAYGSLSRPHYLLECRVNGSDIKWLDIKPAKDYRQPEWSHQQWYHHSFSHEGLRMIAASQCFAPQVTMNESYGTCFGVQYWAREIPAFSLKIKQRLKPHAQRQLAHAVGWQLGRGHALLLSMQERDILLQHIHQYETQLKEAILIIRDEIISCWQYYIDMASYVY